MKKSVLSLVLLFFTVLTYAQKKKVEINYAQEEVSVVLDGELIGLSPDILKIDFELTKSIIFFKRGYYTQRLEVESETVFSKLKIDLVEKPKDAIISNKTLLKPDTLLVSSYITNFDDREIQEIINKTFIKNNYYIGNSSSLFPGAVNEITDSRYKLAIEIVNSKQVRRVYKSPRFMMGYVMIRWALLDKVTNKVVFFEETEGSYFVRIAKTKGLVVSEKMKVVMEGAIKEAQFKLLTNDKFVALVQEK